MSEKTKQNRKTLIQFSFFCFLTSAKERKPVNKGTILTNLTAFRKNIWKNVVQNIILNILIFLFLLNYYLNFSKCH